MFREITTLALIAGLSAPAVSPGAPADRPDEPSHARSADTQPAAAERVDERYRIGASDIVDVRVFDHPELSRSAVRVDGTGIIRMPLLDKDIVAACRTESELAQEIQSRYRELLVNPNVDVFIVTFSSQPVAVTGAVLKPGSFQLERRVRLRELLTLAGGPTEQAGQLIQIVRDEYSPVCEGDRIVHHEPVEIVAGGEVVDAPLEPA
jgi:polysaccharide export outer membrane protein